MKYIKFKLSGKMIYGEITRQYRHIKGKFVRIDEFSSFLQSFLVIKVRRELRGFLFSYIPIVDSDDNDIKVEIFVNATNSNQVEEVSEEEYIAAMVIDS